MHPQYQKQIIHRNLNKTVSDTPNKKLNSLLKNCFSTPFISTFAKQHLIRHQVHISSYTIYPLNLLG